MTREDRALIKQHKERSVSEAAVAILAAGIVAHVGIADANGPVVIPMTYAFDAAEPELLHLHGAHNSRLMGALQDGASVCVTVTLTDGLVYSKTGLNHSVNYRSAVAFGRAATEQPSPERQHELLAQMIGRYFPGRQEGVDYGVIPEKHIDATSFVTIHIEAVSAKQRTGPPLGPGDSDPAVPGTSGVLELRPGL